jgi:putative FmdB family regulatory protein
LPIYDYICTACAHRMEVVHGIHSHGPDGCPVCGSTMRKALVMPAIHFKGSGWAKKDRGAASTTKAAAKAAASSDGASSDGTSPTVSSGDTSATESRSGGDDRVGSSGDARQASGGETKPTVAPSAAVPAAGAE